MNAIPYLALLSALMGLVLAGYFYRNVKAAPPGNDRMVHLMVEIQKGARAFLRQEYAWIAVFVAVMALVIGILIAPAAALTYVIGASLSATAGYAGMTVATMANARTANAAAKRLSEGLSAVDGAELVHPTHGNEVFIRLEDGRYDLAK